MHASSIIAAFAILATSAMASPAMAPRETLPQGGDNCQNYLGDCYSNGCNGVFAQPMDTTGTCTAGTYNGCPCEKCGGDSGYTGACNANDCAGVQGVCTTGNYEGCPCN